MLSYRLNKAKATAGCETILWRDDAKEVVHEIRSMTQGRGADVCGEAVGFDPDRTLMDKVKALVKVEKGSIKVWEACMSALRRGGIVSVLGVYPTTYDKFPLGQFFGKGIILKGGQASAHKYIDQLWRYMEAGQVKLEDVITHRLPLSEIAHGCKIFHEKHEDCVKVVLTP